LFDIVTQYRAIFSEDTLLATRQSDGSDNRWTFHFLAMICPRIILSHNSTALMHFLINTFTLMSSLVTHISQ
jgi:hypothetical protein